MRASSSLSLLAGTSTLGWRARMALRMRDKKSATGSVKFICSTLLSVARSSRQAGKPGGDGNQKPVSSFEFRVRSDSLETRNSKLLSYQDDFATPGISPLSASWRKHKRHRAKRR